MREMDKRGTNVKELMEPLKKGESWGIISDAGLPCVADPGFHLVKEARHAGIPVVAYPGPCSITHALSLSGLSGNGFHFHGYLPRDVDRSLVLLAGIHIFIETPYNSEASLKSILLHLKPKDVVCVACDLMSKQEEVMVYPVTWWREHAHRVDLHKRPTVFILQIT